MSTHSCGLPFFEYFAEEEAQRLLAGAKVIALAPNEILVEEGANADAAYCVLDGELEIVRRIGTDDIPIATRSRCDMVGEMSLLIGEPRTATLRALVPTKVLEISYERLHETLISNPEAMFLLLRTVAARLKQSESSLVHIQKLAGLGTLAAGLAHELNNPSSAIIRAASQLEEYLVAWERWTATLGSLDLSGEERLSIDRLRVEMGSQRAVRSFDDALERADEEDRLHDWLSHAGIGSAALLAAELAESGKTIDQMEAIAAEFGPQHVEAVLNWISAGNSLFAILTGLRASAGAIADIVAGVKSYTRLDQAPIQNVDLHQGIDQALAILRYRLRGIQVHRLYARDMPLITAFASELNQVWSNLIDNAVDALDGAGEITIRTSVEKAFVVVEISDSGPGIPLDAQQHLFEPFFTTKPVGKGTGLGLSISYNIVRKHHGMMTYQTGPGRTTFTVQLPFDAGLRRPSSSDSTETRDGVTALSREP